MDFKKKKKKKCCDLVFSVILLEVKCSTMSNVSTCHLVFFEYLDMQKQVFGK
jgi:hypothetical protein